MILVKIKNIQSQQITNQAQFQTQAEVDAWIVQCESVKAWGHPGAPDSVDELGNVIPAIPKEYEIDQKDITAEVEAEKTKHEQKKKDRLDRVVSLQTIDWSKNLSQKQLQDVLKLLVDDNLKDEN